MKSRLYVLCYATAASNQKLYKSIYSPHENLPESTAEVVKLDKLLPVLSQQMLNAKN